MVRRFLYDARRMRYTDSKLARFRCRLRLAIALIFAPAFMLVLGTACTSPPPSLPPDLPFEAALNRCSEKISGRGDSQPQIIYIKDRHSLNPGFHRLRPQLQAVQRDNRLLVDYLVAQGYTLLGCEFRFGELKEEPDTRQQFQIVRGRLKYDHPNYLDGFSIFQPIRHLLANRPRLKVWGVEDPELYDRDVAFLKTYRQATKHAKRRDLSKEERRSALTKAALAARALDKSLIDRGRAAAENLLRAMSRVKTERAILILGGAHVAGVESALRESDYSYRILQSRSYDQHRPQ
ncbi:MAG: hypothetical protein V3W41_20750 [Planctomycetota bacterium]